MRYAIFSDVHANWQAWSVVRDDILAKDIDISVCLGDVVGYGPSPVRVLDDVLRNCNNIVVGNHDAAVSGRFDLDLFADVPRMAADWTIEQLDEDRLAILRELPGMIEDDYCVFAHAETHAPEEYGYVSDTDDALACLMATTKQLIFVGHTHIPAIFVQLPDGTVHLVDQSEVKIEAGCRYLINVGSVGDPRDGRKDASYCICDLTASHIQLQQVPFDIEAHHQEILQFPQLALPHFLADRVAQGRPVVSADQAIRVKKASRMTVRAARARAIQRRTGLLRSTSVSGMTRRETGVGTAFDLVDQAPAAGKRNSMLIILLVSAVVTLVFMAVALGLVVYMMDDKKKEDDQVQAGASQTSVAKPPGPGLMKVRAIPKEIKKQVRPKLEDNVVVPDDRGILRLTLAKAILNGGYRKEFKGDIECIGYWGNKDDRVMWRLWADSPGTYHVRIRYALDSKSTGHEVYVGCKNEFLVSPIPPTGGWEEFVGRSLGKIKLSKGESTFKIKGEKKGRRSSGLMNLAGIRLTPVELVNATKKTVPQEIEKPAPPAKPAAPEEDGSMTEGSDKVGDFTLKNATLVAEGNGFRFETPTDKKVTGFAVKQAAKPLKRATFTFRARLVSGGTGRYTNVYFVFGNSASEADLVRCRVHLGKKRRLGIDNLGGKKPGDKKISKSAAKTVDVKVDVDLEAKTVRLTSCGISLAGRVSRKLDAITRYGYGCNNATSIVSVISVAEH